MDQHGEAQVHREEYDEGHYYLHNVRGYKYYYVEDTIPVTSLKIDRSTWMVDDVNHWWLIQDIAEQMFGDVVVGGLGLGLIVHALAKNKNVKSVTVLEQNQDVIDLITPLLPSNCTVFKEDVFEYFERAPRKFDSAFVDLWVTNNVSEGLVYWVTEVIPLADMAHDNLGCQMWCLGFPCGKKPVDIQKEDTCAGEERSGTFIGLQSNESDQGEVS